MDAVIAAMKAGGRSGPKTILNPAPFPSKGLPRELYAHCYLITPNETEFLTMSGTEILKFGPDKFRKAFAGQRNDFTIIVTRGASGVATTNYQEPVFTFAAPKVKPIDTVGAGDCFNGCLAAHYATDSKPGLEKRIQFAVCGASLKVTRQGAQAGMPYRHEILKMLKQM
jgi:ribokinase